MTFCDKIYRKGRWEQTGGKMHWVRQGNGTEAARYKDRKGTGIPLSDKLSWLRPPPGESAILHVLQNRNIVNKTFFSYQNWHLRVSKRLLQYHACNCDVKNWCILFSVICLCVCLIRKSKLQKHVRPWLNVSEYGNPHLATRATFPDRTIPCVGP